MQKSFETRVENWGDLDRYIESNQKIHFCLYASLLFVFFSRR